MYKANSFYIYDDALGFNPKLISCLEVECGDKYSYTKTQKMIEREPKNMLCAIRTISGKGRIITNDGLIDLDQDSLVLLPNSEIIKYLSVSKVWIYDWFNFTLPTELPFFEPSKVYHVLIDENENSNLKFMFELLKNYNRTSTSLATMIFSTQFYKWIYLIENLQFSSLPYYKEITECLSIINKNLKDNINVAELANKYNFSERHFRKIFTGITGKAPKTYHKILKLKSAAARLKNTYSPINIISDDLGYYSQFQFCRDFKEFFGVSPSEYRAATNPKDNNDNS